MLIEPPVPVLPPLPVVPVPTPPVVPVLPVEPVPDDPPVPVPVPVPVASDGGPDPSPIDASSQPLPRVGHHGDRAWLLRPSRGSWVAGETRSRRQNPARPDEQLSHQVGMP